MAIKDSLVSYYKLDESSGNALDAEGSNDLTVTGATQNDSEAIINTSYSFDGVNDFLVDTTASGLPTTVGSISAWVRHDGSISQSEDSIIEMGNGGTTRILLRTKDADNIALFIDGTEAAIKENVITSNTWFHVVVTWDTVNDLFVMYIDGSDVSATTLATGNPATVDEINIGSDHSDNQLWGGKLDEIGIWTKILTSSEVTSLYNSGNGLAYPFLEGTSMQINIGDVWKEVPAMQINIGDVWKAVAGAQINIGDAWKTIF